MYLFKTKHFSFKFPTVNLSVLKHETNSFDMLRYYFILMILQFVPLRLISSVI